ncbi:MAG: copper resistance CopC family protein [Chloroflexota bacterium]
MLAHADLVTANPAPGEVLSAPPSEILLIFNEPIGAGSTFTIFDKSFGQIPVIVETSSENQTEIIGRNVEISEAGVYTVQWLVISQDGHSIDGSYSFAVDPNSRGEQNMELIAAAEGTAVNLPGWFAWMMVGLAILTPIIVWNITKSR